VIIGGMAAKRVDKGWAEQDLDTLLELAWAAIKESMLTARLPHS
jgi:hypothetical protein